MLQIVGAMLGYTTILALTLSLSQVSGSWKPPRVARQAPHPDQEGVEAWKELVSATSVIRPHKPRVAYFVGTSAFHELGDEAKA